MLGSFGIPQIEAPQAPSKQFSSVKQVLPGGGLPETRRFSLITFTRYECQAGLQKTTGQPMILDIYPNPHKVRFETSSLYCEGPSTNRNYCEAITQKWWILSPFCLLRYLGRKRRTQPWKVGIAWWGRPPGARRFSLITPTRRERQAGPQKTRGSTSTGC